MWEEPAFFPHSRMIRFGLFDVIHGHGIPGALGVRIALGRLGVHDQLAGLHGLDQRVVVVHGEALQGPGVHGQAHGVLVDAQGDSAAQIGPGAVIGLADHLVGALGDALQGGGHDGVGLEGLVDVHADDSAVVGGSRGGDGIEDGAAGGEHDLGAGLIPAGDQGLQLGRGREGSAIGPGELHVHGLAHFLGGIVRALDEAVAIAHAGGIGSAAAAGKAQRLIAILDHGVAGQVATLLFLEGNAHDVVQAHSPTVDEDELHIGELVGGLLEYYLTSTLLDNNFQELFAKVYYIHEFCGITFLKLYSHYLQRGLKMSYQDPPNRIQKHYP